MSRNATHKTTEQKQFERLAGTRAGRRAVAGGGGLQRLENRMLFAVGGAPLVPTNLLATGASSNQIDLTWADKSTNEIGFAVQRAGTGGGFLTVGTVSANTAVYHDGGLSAGAKYTYRVIALGTGGADSNASAQTSGNTLDLFQLPAGHTAAQRTGGYQWQLPGNRVDLMSDNRNNVFYEGEQVTFNQRWNGGQAKRYEVRNYWGELVDSGAAAAVASKLKVNVTQPGWYKIYLYADTVDARFGDVIGGTMFSIFRNDPNFPKMPSPAVVTTNQGSDEVARGVTGMGPQRHNVTNALDPDGMIAGLAPEIAFDKQYYTPYDTVRQRDLLIAFSNGTRDWNNRGQDQAYLDGVRKIVQRFHNDVKYYEGRNEPNFFVSPEQYVEELRDVYNVVKSVDPTCKIIGPGCVDIQTGYGLQWLDRFLAAGGGKYIDAVSFHAYNNLNGDIALARKSYNELQGVLNKYGMGNIEKWQTEQGAFAALYGTFQPRLQGRWDMFQMLFQEQYGITKEHNHLWYDRSGFWDVPAFWEVADDNSLTPAAALMRVYSEEVFGTRFAKAYDFGASGNNQYLGNLYTGPSGKAVAAFMSTGNPDGKVTLKVTGGSTLKVTSAFGVSKTLQVVNGKVVLDVPEIPVYVDLAAGQTVDVVPIDYGTNLARQAGVTLQTSGNGQHPLGGGWQNSISKVTNGKLDTWYADQSADGDVWYDNTPDGQQKWFQINLASQQSVGHVTIYSGVPWSWRGSLLDYELQYEQNGEWVTADHVQENPKTIGVYSPWLRSTVDSFYSDQWVFEHDFAPVVTSKLRLLVHESTYGGAATLESAQAGGQPGLHNFQLREIEVYGPQQGSDPGEVALVNSGPVDEGSAGTVTFVNTSALTGARFFYDFDNDGTFDVSDSAQSWAAVPAAFLADGAKTMTIRGRVVTTDGRVTEYSTVLAVRNVAPTAALTGSTVKLGSAGTVTFSGMADPSAADTAAGLRYSFDFNNDGVFEVTNSASPTATVPTSFLATAGAYTVRGRISDKDGGYTDYTATVTVTSGTSAGNSASFVRTDATTQGNWKGVYGGEGFSINADVTSLPSYVQLGITGTADYTWNWDTTETRSLLRANGGGSGRIAATWYGGQPTFDVNITDGKVHAVAIYLLDYDGRGRTQKVDVIDANTGAVLDTRTASDLANGKYLVFNLSGHVKIRMTATAGPNAVVSGIFFGTGTTPVPTGPTATDDAYAATEDTVLNLATALGVLANDKVGTTGSALRAVLGTGPKHASNFALNADGSFTYTPAADFFGTDTFTYRVTDGTSTSGEATVTISVAGVNDVPVAVTDNKAGTRGRSLTFSAIDLLGNDSAGPSEAAQTLRVVGVSATADTHGSVVLNSDGTITYTPAAGYYGAASFQYTLGDNGTTGVEGISDAKSATGMVNVQVTAQAPVVSAGPDRTANEGAAVAFDGSASVSPDGLPLTYSWDFGDGTTATGANPTHAYADNGSFTLTLTVSDGTFTRTDVKQVVVNNVAPTGSLVGSTVAQGSAGTVSFGSSTDASAADAAAGLRYSFDFNNDGVFEVTNSASPTATVPASYLAAAGDHTVRGRVTDKDGGYTDYTATVRVNGTTAPAGTASFVGTDATTGGNWKGVYGADGRSIVGDGTVLPGYAGLDASGVQTWVWANSADVYRQATQRGAAGRIASTWYGPSTFTLDLKLTDGQAHQVAFYMLDFDGGSRSQKVEILDGSSGAVLNTQTATGFTQGKYLVYSLSGHVKVRFTLTGGINAVLGGIFFGGAGDSAGGASANSAPVLANGSASLPGINQGDTGGSGQSVANLLAGIGATDADAGAMRGLAVTGTDGAQGVWQYSRDGGTTWSAVGAVSASNGLLLSDAATNRLRFVPAAGFTGTASLTVRAWDQTTGTNGAYADTTANGGTSAFSAASAAVGVTVSPVKTGTSSATFVKTDTTTQGSWKGSYGSAGAYVARNVDSVPSWAKVTTDGAYAYEWANPTSDVRALQNAAGTSRSASTLYGGQFTATIDVTDGKSHRVSLYFLDWDNAGRSEKVEIIDPATGQVLDSRMMSDFAGGKYLTYDVSGTVTVRVTHVSGANAVLGGVFFE